MLGIYQLKIIVWLVTDHIKKKPDSKKIFISLENVEPEYAILLKVNPYIPF